MIYNPYSLKDKRILITGASSGIGKASAIECSKLGASLVITARNEMRLNETLKELDVSEGQKHKCIICDLTDSKQVENLVNESGVVDGVVLCSGKGLTLPFMYSIKEKFYDIFETNFFSPVEFLRLLFKRKQISNGGSVVIIASLGGTAVYSGGNCIYGASKAAINSLMKFCAKEFAPRRIRVNSICPGMVETPLIHRGTISDEQLQEDIKRYPLKRYGLPEDIAYGIIYLISDASSWMTGHAMVLDGGISI